MSLLSITAASKFLKVVHHCLENFADLFLLFEHRDPQKSVASINEAQQVLNSFQQVPSGPSWPVKETDVTRHVVRLMTCKSVQGQRPMDGSRVQTAHTSADRHKHVETNNATPQGPGGRWGDAGAPAQGLRGNVKLSIHQWRRGGAVREC